MSFWGSDTEQLRALADLGSRLLTALDERRTTLGRTVRTVPWHGGDAEGFQELWTHVESRWGVLHASALAACAELIDHADAQDEASDAQADASTVSAPAIGPLVDTGIHTPETSGGPAVVNSAANKPPVDRQDEAPDGASEHHDNPEDELPTKAGSGGRTTTTTLETGTVTTEISEDADGNPSAKVTSTVPLIDVKGEHEGTRGTVSAEVTRDVTVSGQAKDNGDGTVTYTLESGLSASEKAAIEAKRGISYGTAESSSDTYQVTVPKGTPLEKVIGINPYDPSSIPPGAAIVFSDEHTTSQEGSVSPYPLTTLEGSRSHGEGTSTAVTREKDGSLSVMTGPTEKLNERLGVRLGDEKLNAHLSTSDTAKDSTFQVAKFSADQSGDRAYAEALASGRIPERTGPGVADAYTEQQSSRVVDVTGGATAGPLTHETTVNQFTRETVTRTYPSGHQETAEQWLPQGDSHRASVVESHSSGRPPTYVVTTPAGDPEVLSREYGASAPRGNDSSILLTQQEADRIAEGAKAWRRVPQDASTAEALSIITSTSRTSDDAVRDMDTYHNATIDSDGKPTGYDSSAKAPGQVVDPNTHQVRDGKVQPIPPDPRGRALASG